MLACGRDGRRDDKTFQPGAEIVNQRTIALEIGGGGAHCECLRLSNTMSVKRTVKNVCKDPWILLLAMEVR